MLEHGPEMTRRAVISPLSRTHSLATDLGYKKPTIASLIGLKTQALPAGPRIPPVPSYWQQPLSQWRFHLAFVLLPVNKTLSVSDSML